MHKGRLEAFSDGVLAIIITIMVLELKVPHGDGWSDLLALCPVLISYILSFIYIGIYWNNHHHMFQAVQKVDGTVMWANMHLLFWLSLLPFVTGWTGENHFSALPMALYGIVMLCAAVAYYILTLSLTRLHGKNSDFARALGGDFKGKVSPLLYVAGILCSFVSAWLGFAFYILVAGIWLVPDKRFEKALEAGPQVGPGA